MSNWLRPRRSSTSTCQLPVESADSRYGWSLPAAVTVIVAFAIDVPRSVYEVAILGDVDHGAGRVGDGERRRLREADQLDAQEDGERGDQRR